MWTEAVACVHNLQYKEPEGKKLRFRLDGTVATAVAKIMTGKDRMAYIFIYKKKKRINVYFLYKE